jgi:cell division septation protein DedD
VDSLLAAAPPGSTRYAEVLYWRAAFAATSAAAERDYQRLSVGYPLSPRAADALIALAQLEYVRGDKPLAVHHLQRLLIEHPAGVGSAKTNFWAARVLFEAQDSVRACSALRAARSTTEAGEVELRNQIEFEVPKCSAVGRGATREARSASTERPGSQPAAEPAAEASSADARGAEERGAAPDEKPPAKAAPKARGEKAPAKAATAAAPAAGRSGFAVQVAAYKARAEAQALAAKLSGRGYRARVVGSAAPYRVQVGRYASRAEAAAALARVRAAKLNGFVVDAGAR